MKKGKKEKESDGPVEVQTMPEYYISQQPVVEEEKEELEERNSSLNGWMLFSVVVAVIGMLFFGLSLNASQQELDFYEKELTTFCRFYGYERMYKDDVAVYCVSDNKAISLLKVQARYLDYYLGGKKYDIRNYKVNYKDCPADVEMKYSTSKNVMQVVC